jgi:hypothetical protein
LGGNKLSYANILFDTKNNSPILGKFLRVHFLELMLKTNVYTTYYYTKKFASEFEISHKYNFIPELFSAMCISLTDIAIINPFERIKVSMVQNYPIKKNIKWFLMGQY